MRLIWTLFIALAGLAAAAPAKAITLSCDGCTETEMWGRAYNSFAYLPMGSKYPHYITNFENGTVRKYYYSNNMTDDWDPETDIFEEYILETEVEQPIIDMITRLHAVAGPLNYDLPATMGSGEASTQQDPWPNSAWDVVGSDSADQQVATYLFNEKMPFRHQIAVEMAVVNPFPWFHPENINLTLNVKFPDGSKAQYTYNAQMGKYERVPDTARDSNDNKIPETVADVANGGSATYQYGGGGGGEVPSDDLQSMLDRLASWGIYVGPPSGGGGGVGRIGIACVTAGETTLCEFYIY